MTNHSDTLASFGLLNICTSLANIHLLKQKVQLLQRMLPIVAVNPFCHNFFPIKTPNHNMRIQISTLGKLYSREVFYNSWFMKISLYITSCSSQYSFLQHIWCRYCKQTMVTENTDEKLYPDHSMTFNNSVSISQIPLTHPHHPYRWLSCKLWYLQCKPVGYIIVYHWSIAMSVKI